MFLLQTSETRSEYKLMKIHQAVHLKKLVSRYEIRMNLSLWFFHFVSGEADF